MKKALINTLIGLAVLVFLVIIALPLLPVGTYKNDIETFVSQEYGLNAEVNDISLSALPVPGVNIKGFRLSNQHTTLLHIDHIRIIPSLASLFTDSPVIRKIHLSGLTAKQQDLTQLAGLPGNGGDRETKSSAISVKRVTAENSVLYLDEKQVFGPFILDMELSDSLPTKILLSLEDQRFDLSLVADLSTYKVEIQATDWTPPFKPVLLVSHLRSVGTWHPGKLHLDQIRLNAYQGEAKGNLIIDWNQGWIIDSRVRFNNLDTGALLKHMGKDYLDGTGSGQFTLRSSAGNAAMLADNLHIAGDAIIVRGHIYDTDLEQAAKSLSSEWLAGGQTPFDELKSRVELTQDEMRFTDLKISSSVLSAKGKMNVIERARLDGRINVGLDDPSGLVTMPLMISGTIDQPKVRPTDEALAGAAVGTAVLGPGVGTAVGVKAGEFLGKIGSLFGGEEDENANTGQQETE
jgi:hypothetical protein